MPSTARLPGVCRSSVDIIFIFGHDDVCVRVTMSLKPGSPQKFNHFFLGPCATVPQNVCIIHRLTDMAIPLVSYLLGVVKSMFTTRITLLPRSRKR